MIYYFCAYSPSVEITDERKLVISTAGCNRMSEIANTLSSENDITIISVALTNSEASLDDCIYQVNERCKIYFPAIKSGKNQNVTMIKDAMEYVKKNIQAGDIILFYNAHYSLLPVIYAFAHKKSVKLVYQIEEFYSTCDYYRFLKKWLLILTERYFSKVCDAYIAVSETLANKYLKKKPHIISYGYVESSMAVNGTKQDETFNIVYSGRLDVDGGIDILLESIAKIEQKCNLIITGSGPLKENVLQYVNENPLVNVQYRGFVSEEELDNILQQADVCLSMLRTDKAFSQKSFPSKVIKYLSYGNVVISSNVPALKDLGETFVNLYIYEDEKQLVEIINRSNGITKEISKEKQKEVFHDFYNKKRKELATFFSEMIK